MRAECHAESSPGIEMILGRDCAADALVGADRPILLEGGGAGDGGLVGARRLVDVVGAAVGGDGAFLGGS